jgi:tellurite resistance protein
MQWETREAVVNCSSIHAPRSGIARKEWLSKHEQQAAVLAGLKEKKKKKRITYSSTKDAILNDFKFDQSYKKINIYDTR